MADCGTAYKKKEDNNLTSITDFVLLKLIKRQ